MARSVRVGKVRRFGAVLLPLALVVLGGRAVAVEHGASPDPKALAPLKKLFGTWQGNARVGDQLVPVTITYASTAGGSAIVEHLFPGTPHEMMSVYTVEGDRLAMTHYCSLGNHPKMMLKTSDAHSLSFEATGAEGLRAPAEMHMHAMTVSWTDADHIRETWTSFVDGQAKDQKVFDLARKP